MHASPQLRSSAPPRPGLTVVEVLVALVIVSIGLLGIAGSTSLALRSTLDAAHRRDAAQRAASRVAQLAASGCGRAATGSAADPARQITERWTVLARANGFAIVSDTVRWMSARGERSFSLTTAITC